LQPEFAKALASLSGRERLDGPAPVLRFRRPDA